MKKMNKILAVLLAFTMMMALAACGGSGTKKADENPYNLDYESTEIQTMSDERAGEETLAETKDEFFRGLNVFTDTDLTKLTYEDVVKHIGVDPSAYQYEATNGRRVYFWYAQDSTGPWLSVYFDKDGSLYGSGSANLN